jgi:ATP-binding cassette subfamily F protein uup
MEGDYDYFLEKEKERREAHTPKTAPTKKPAKTPRKKKSLSWAEQKEFETIEDDIMLAEEKIEQLENEMAAPDFYEKHGHQLQEITAALNEAKEKAAKLFERWEFLTNKLEN